MTVSLLFFGILGLITTALSVYWNRHLFTGDAVGRVTPLEAAFYFFGVLSLVLGWYFNVRYTHAVHDANYVNFTKDLFANWAADSAAQDYIIANVVLLPLWTISDGRRRGIKAPWIFFVMSLFTSFAFAMAAYLAFVERQIRYSRAASSALSSTA
jgi:hypothetical protein